MSQLHFLTLDTYFDLPWKKYNDAGPDGDRTQIPLHIPARNPIYDDWSKTPQSEQGPGRDTSEHGYTKIDEDNDPTRVRSTIDDTYKPCII